MSECFGTMSIPPNASIVFWVVCRKENMYPVMSIRTASVRTQTAYLTLTAI